MAWESLGKGPRVEDRKSLHGPMDGGLVRDLVTSVHGGMNLMALVHSLPNSCNRRVRRQTPKSVQHAEG